MNRTRHDNRHSAANSFSRSAHSHAVGRSVPHLLIFTKVYTDLIPVGGAAETKWRFEKGIESMKCKMASLSLGVALIFAASMPAVAGDWNNGAGGLKDYGRGAVAVPAPMPVPIFEANYYFRADFGIGTSDDPETRYIGEPYGQTSTTGTFGFLPGFENDAFDNYASYGVGVGYKWGNGIRTDLTAESRARAEVRREGRYEFTDTGGNYVHGDVNDETTIRGAVVLINAYYDFERLLSDSITPYVGAGLGFAWNDFSRGHDTVQTVCNGVGTSFACGGGGGATTTETVEDKVQHLSLAASATVGAAFRIYDNVSLDMNYRFLYIDGSESAGIDIFGTSSLLSIDATYVHQVRAGVRYDLY